MKEMSLTCDSDAIIYQLAPMPEARLTPARVSVTFPRLVLDVIDMKAKAHGLSRSGFLRLAAEAFGD